MKKTFIILLMGLTFSISANAELEIDTLHFQIIYDGPGDNDNDGNGIPRTPVVPPSAAIDGHTLYFINGCDDTGLAVVDLSEDEVYSTTIPTVMKMLVLPEWLQGTFELQIRCGQYIFVAEIEL